MIIKSVPHPISPFVTHKFSLEIDNLFDLYLARQIFKSGELMS